MQSLKFFLSYILITSCLLSCAKKQDDDNPYQNLTEKQLYNEADDYIKKGQYTSAIKRLEAMGSLYPFSNYAEKTQMNMIYAYYQNTDYPSAAAEADRYIQLYPRSDNVDYAYYMKGLANFQQPRGTFAKILPLDESWRDPGTQTEAYSDFASLIEKFPNSRYKADSLQHMIYLRNMFAQRELNAATFYFERKMYVAAAERASFMLKNYQQAPANKQALILLAKANRALGLKNATNEADTIKITTFKNTAQ